MASRSLAALGKLSRRKVLGDLVVASLKGPLACIHTTSVVSRGKKKVAPRVSKITKMREAGSTEEDIQSFIDNIVKRKNATQEYLSKLETVAEACREELRLQEEERKDVKGEQMRKEAMEREEQARNFALLLKNNDELSRERELRNLILQEKKQKEAEEKALIEMEKDRALFEKRRLLVLQAIEESKTFVTKENLEEKIAYALENEENYNFAITPEGEKIYSTKPPGNFSEHGWQGASPAAFFMGGISLGEHDFLFQKKYASTLEKGEDEGTEKINNEARENVEKNVSEE